MSIDKRAARLSTLAAVGLVLVGLLGVRLWFLQTVEADELREKTEEAAIRMVYIPPERGRIIDADGRVVAGNKRILTLGVDWQLLRDDEDRLKIFRRLSGWVGVPVEHMEAEYKKDVHSPFRPFPIKRDIDEETATAILERIEDFPGTQVEYEWQRVYPYAPMASHLIGYMGAITEDQYKDPAFSGYEQTERVGQFGAERWFESVLHGQQGYKKIEVDAFQRPLRVIEERDPVPGLDVQLTIDLDLQQFVEQSVQTTLRARRTIQAKNPTVRDPFTNKLGPMDKDSPAFVNYKAPAGASVVMNYLTGEVAALASYPDFDNRWFEANISGEKFEEVFPIEDQFGEPIDPDESILVNRAIQGRYNVGSTFKPFTAFAALSSGLMGTNDYYLDDGIYELETVTGTDCAAGVKCRYRNAWCSGLNAPCRYGNVDVHLALAVSSDTFFYRIGELIMNNEFAGTTILQDKVREFGFGKDTGIELPFEFDGTVPDADLKRTYADEGVINPEEGAGYFTGDNVQFAIGQGLFSATPLHLAQGYAAIANGGSVYKPTILKQIYEHGTPNSQPGWVDIEQAVPYDHPDFPVGTVLSHRVDLTDEQRDEIVSGLRRVITGPGTNGGSTTGEEVYFDVPDGAIHIAGKTGTAQGLGNFPWNDSSVFVGFATNATNASAANIDINENNPWVVASYLEKSGYGSTASAPLTKCVFMALSGTIALDPVELSEPLDLNSTVAAPEREQPGKEQCWTREDAKSAVLYAPDEAGGTIE